MNFFSKSYTKDNTLTNPIYNFQFFMVCFSSLLFSASFNMLIPELPAYLSSLGGAEYKGLIVALFTLTAAISRPFSGKLTDLVGRVPVMAFGSIVCFICGFLYPVLTSVSGFLLLRLLHGFSTGFKPTATAAYVADLIPQNRWGEAIGLHGVFFSTGMAVGPGLGSTIRLYFSMDVLFYVSSLFALLSIVILLNMKETLPVKQKFSFSMLKISVSDLYDIKAIPAAIVTLCSHFSFGVLVTVIPDWSIYLGIKNKGLFFVVYTLSSLLIRFFAGKVSDRYGRKKVVFAGLLVLISSTFVIAFFQSVNGLVAGSILYGISSGILAPALNAWTIDHTHPENRGKAVSTMYIALEVGIGLGALYAGWYFRDIIKNIPIVLSFASGLTFLAVIYVSRPVQKLIQKSTKKTKSR